VLYEQGCDIDSNDTSGVTAAVAAAAQADYTIFIGGLITCQEIGEECQEAEARDRSSPVGVHTDIGKDVGIGLPGRQLETLQALANSTNTTLILVLLSGSAVATPWAADSPRVAAIVQHFYSGVLGGEALADVLFGKSAPAGRLPVMVPKSEEQLPPDYLNQAMMASPGRTHRYFTGTPLYSFGFGLGYSSFRYSRLAVSHDMLPAGKPNTRTPLTVTVDVTNNGEYDAAPSEEVVMVFARPRLGTLAGAVSPPRQILLGFEKLRVPPGQTVTAKVLVPAKRFRLVNQAGSHELLPGQYDLRVGVQAPAGSLVGAVPDDEPLSRLLRIE